MSDGYKIVLRDGYPFHEQITYETENDNGTTTAIDLRTKRLILTFTPRGASSPVLVLDSAAPANDNGSVIDIVNDATGRFSFDVTEAEITAGEKHFGRAILELVGENEPLMDVPYSWK